MQKWKTSPEVYRLPPDKKNPKGERVYKAVEVEPMFNGSTPVVRVRDGHMFYTESKITKEAV